MTLGTGQIQLSQVNTELGRTSTATIDLNDSEVRTLFNVPSGTISMSNGHGKFKNTVSSITGGQTTNEGNTIDYGYSGIQIFGSASGLTVNGVTVLEIYNENNWGVYNLYITLSGSVAQSFWRQMTINSVTRLSSAASSFNHNGGNSQWIYSLTGYAWTTGTYSAVFYG